VSATSTQANIVRVELGCPLWYRMPLRTPREGSTLPSGRDAYAGQHETRDEAIASPRVNSGRSVLDLPVGATGDHQRNNAADRGGKPRENSHMSPPLSCLPTLGDGRLAYKRARLLQR
jgi:hypothetical protein